MQTKNQTKKVRVRFLPDDVTVEAEAGEPLLQVASRAGLVIPTGCLMGSCHACEVELQASPTAEVRSTQPSTQSICACISAVPAGCPDLTINLFVDPTW